MDTKSIQSANFFLFVLLLITMETTEQTNANFVVAIATSVKTLSRVDLWVASSKLKV